MRMTISVCTYQSGDFEVMMKDTDTGEEVELSGNQELSAEEFKLLTRLAPACVWTKYEEEKS